MSKFTRILNFIRRRPNYNPFAVNEEMSLLGKDKPTGQVKLCTKVVVNHDTKIFRFNLPNENLVLGTRVGEAIQLSSLIEDRNTKQLQKVSRHFIPISRIDDCGFADFMIKIYKKDDVNHYIGGLFTNHLDNLNEGDTVEISGPNGKFSYDGEGKFRFKTGDNNNEIIEKNDVRHVGMIASGSGITAFFQLIEAISTFPKDVTNLSLLYINKDFRDILLLEELVSFKEDNRINLSLVLESPTQYWPGISGKLTKDIVKDYMPPPGSNSIIMICGSREIQRNSLEFLNALGYDKEKVFLL